MFAVIKTGGKQYRVVPEDQFTIERLPGEAGDLVTFKEVLMVGSTVGAPFVAGASVTAEIIGQTRGKKVISFKKRRRQNSKRSRGHRQDLTLIRVAEILTDGKAPSKTSAARTKPAKTAKPVEATDEAAKPAKVAEKAAEPKQAAASAPASLFTAPKGDADKLTTIKGIGPVAEKQLNEQGITTFAQIAKLSDKDVARIDEHMPFSAAQIEDWREQAKELATK
ncbi:50S ribosomal protein L21 [Aurantimonas marianensis]|uniref:Large ribosomal subunit protein bL21 n=1 Tax=Aurantimonas marianensis TaxID=2920428 RepID=A0A9X2H6Q3_9HYPH|nr:50S ribosomal protein L21 [Aurantimonas marianensis]MCP3055216.1 50S ribosomal protein L21 [Aurantimonas marianensis]